MSEHSLEESITFNGINGATGGYLTDPMPVEDLVELVKRTTWDKDHLNDLKARKLDEEAAFRVLPQYGDGSDLKKVGWGMIFPAGADPAHVDDILLAMDELIQLRQGQAGKRFKIFRGKDGFRWENGRPEAKNDFLTRHGASVGPADPNYVPFYLLIVADPQSIPFSFQYELDIQYGVGRIYFNSLEEYARYAQSIVAAEKGDVSLKRRAVFFGVANPDDKATMLSAEHLVKPLNRFTDDISAEFELGWTAELVEPEDADREALKSLLGGGQTPAFLFTASHGMAWPYLHESQYKYQGALVCQDWGGPATEKVSRQHFLAAEDIPDSHSLLGTIVFNFACFGAGTPYWDEYAIAKNQARSALAARPFLSSLPMRLLSHPNGGALAVIGHIERAWTYSFRWDELDSQTQAFQSLLYQLMDGKPVGMALDDMNVRYAEIAAMLSANLQEIKYDPQAVSPYRLTFQWTANNDARGYAILGDPAVRAPVAEKEAKETIRPAITLVSRYPGILPVVFAAEALDSLKEVEKLAIAKENEMLQKHLASFAVEGTAESPNQESAMPSGQEKTRMENTLLGEGLPTDPGSAPPKQEVQEDQKPAQAAGRPVQPFASPMDGLAFALQAYVSEEEVSFAFGAEGVSYNLMDDARDKVREVVVNLNNALANLAKKMEEITREATKLTVTTGVVDNLQNFEPDHADKRFITRIDLDGDIEVYAPRQAEEIDAVLLSLHREMVAQALNNRLEILKAIGETIASLFGAQRT